MYRQTGEPRFARKSIERTPFGDRIWLENPPMTFAALRPDDLLNTTDLLRLFSCSSATLYRCIYKGGLKPARRVGREMLFTKRNVLRWLEKRQRKPGR